MSSNLSNTLHKIRDYTKQHLELSKSHHFLFNCSINKNHEYADVIVIGLNPGESQTDLSFITEDITEETNEFDFQDEIGRSKASIKWYKTCEQMLPNSKIFLSEFFFWSSKDIKESFLEKFGYSFKQSPHFEFCRECNKELIDFHKPKLIVAPGASFATFFSKIYEMQHIKTIKSDGYRKGKKITQQIIQHYEWNEIPFIFTKHWSGARISNAEKEKIIQYLGVFI
jgi:hypothetical protein